MRLYRSPAVSTILSIPSRACSTTVAATRLTRVTGDCFRRLPARFFRDPPRAPAPRRFDALFRDVFRPADFRLDARPPRFERLDVRPRFRAPDDRDPLLPERPPRREPPRVDFFLDAMNPLLVRWW
jgi:hypothetical protein